MEGLLDLIPRLYAETPCSEVAFGAVVKALLSGLVSRVSSRGAARHAQAWLRQAGSGRMRWTSVLVPVLVAKLRTWDSETTGRSTAVWDGQGKDIVFPCGWVLAEYGGSTGRSGNRV